MPRSFPLRACATLSVLLLIGACDGPTEPSKTITISSISPSPLLAGQTATVNGTGFTGTTFTFDGIDVTLESRTATQVRFQVPATCSPAGPVLIEATSPRATTSFETEAVPANIQAPLAVGEFVSTSGAGSAGHCIQLSSAANATYLVGLQSLRSTTGLQGATVTSETGIEWVAAPDGVAAGTFRVGAEGRRVRDALVAPSAFDDPGAMVMPDIPGILRHRAHNRVMEENLRLLRAARPASVVDARSATEAPERAVPNVGETLTIKVPGDPLDDNASFCSTFTDVTGTVRAVGARSIWVSDNANPAGGFTTADYQSFSDQYDAEIGATLDVIAGPMTDLDQNARVVILVSRQVNAFGDRNGFVSSGDFFPECQASNAGEIFYGVAPDPTGADALGVVDVEDARLLYPSLIAHEITHIIHLSRQQQAGTLSGLTVWELEGIATWMEEKVGHAVLGNSPGQNYGRPRVVASGQLSPWYGDMFNDLASYFGGNPGPNSPPKIQGAPEQCSWLARDGNGPCTNSGRLPYGVPANLFRWIADHYHTPATEGVMARTLIDAGTATHGYPVLSAMSGEPYDKVLMFWAASLYTDDRFFSSGLLSQPSWDFPDVFEAFIANARLIPMMRTYPSSDAVQVNGGSTAYFQFTGSHAQLAFSAGQLPDFMRLWVGRVQ